MKIDIIYRCCNNETPGTQLKSIRPVWFNKLNCLSSFLHSIEINADKIGDVIFLHDGPKGILYHSIPKQFKTIDINNQNNLTSLLKTFEIADNLQNNLYFVEDDYLHLPHSISTIYHGTNNFQLVTGYDHLDRYTRLDDVTKGKEYIAFSKKTNCHWRTAESTCCTWSCTRELWNSAMRSYARKFELNDRLLFRSLNFDHNIRLWTPILGVSTQVDQNLSPGIDWEQFNNTL